VICYYDTSAFVPILIAESSSNACQRLWSEADSVVTTRLLYVESAAALAQGLRTNRLTGSEHRSALRALDRHWLDFDVVEADHALIERAAQLTQLASLRGYDAVHCAAAEQVEEDDLVVAAGDQRLLAACAQLGISTADVNNPDYL
jgi:predicted nucleic acid-binding protein